MIVRVLVVLTSVVAVFAQNQPAQRAPPAMNPNAPPQERWEPPDPTNLKVFPKTIPKRDLVNAMKGFTHALGVRCEYCHVGDGSDLSRFDFASDDKRQKRNARVMLRMMSDINFKYLPDIPEPRPAGTNVVTCYTCHRGDKKPLIAAPPASEK